MCCVVHSRSVVSDSLWPYGLYPPGSSVHRILQARILEWVAISFSMGPSPSRDQTWVSCIAGRFFTIWATREAAVKSLNMDRQKSRGTILGKISLFCPVKFLEKESAVSHWQPILLAAEEKSILVLKGKFCVTHHRSTIVYTLHHLDLLLLYSQFASSANSSRVLCYLLSWGNLWERG